MLKKIDKFVLRNFLGVFFLTFAVVVFILLVQVVVNYFKELVGKDISYGLFSELLGFFALALTPQALPLAVLLGTLISFGNLGEHYELTALKGAGISLLRVLRPVGIVCLLLTGLSFWFQEQVVPWANLQAYSLLYDLKQKKPTLDIKEGVFYNGIPGYSIKIKEKDKDGQRLRNVIIYNHTHNMGNKEVILADSGRMYTMLNDKYLVLELFKGNSYNDQQDFSGGGMGQDRFIRNQFKASKLVFSLASFDLSRTDQSLFLHNRQMKNTTKLRKDLDSIQKRGATLENTNFTALQGYYIYYGKEWLPSDSLRNYYKRIAYTYQSPQSIANLQEYITKKQQKYEQYVAQKKAEAVTPEIKKLQNKSQAIATENAQHSPAQMQAIIRQAQMQESDNVNIDKIILEKALMQARNVRVATQSRSQELNYLRSDKNDYAIQIHKRYAEALACFLMFLIGAPLGAIIKKGGLGVPVIVSVAFFVVHYILTMTGEKWAKENFVGIEAGIWTPSILLFLVGLFFLRQAKNDSRILETDLYLVWLDRIKVKLKKKK